MVADPVLVTIVDFVVYFAIGILFGVQFAHAVRNFHDTRKTRYIRYFATITVVMALIWLASSYGKDIDRPWIIEVFPAVLAFLVAGITAKLLVNKEQG